MDEPLTAEAALFKRLPSELFGPLASPNRRGYWRVLCNLHRDRFGPDAPVPPSNGFVTRDIWRDIEGIILAEAQWLDEEGATHTTPQARAMGAYYRLRDSGWLHETRLGARQMVIMQPIVADFLGRLIDFAEKGPAFLGGKVRSIYLNLSEVVEGRAGGDGLIEAAEQSKNLLRYMSATRLEVREFMDKLRTSQSTAEFAARFFTDYVQRIFIGDYSELRTKDHPMIHRSTIIDMALRIEQHMRPRLVEWYRDKAAAGNPSLADQMFQRDIDRIMQLNNLEEYLARLDEEVDSANRKALTYLDYRLRTPNRVGAIIQEAITSIIAASESHERLLVPFPPGELMSPQRLKQEREQPAAVTPSLIRSRQPSPRSLALRHLHTLALQARRVGRVEIASYLSRHQFRDGAIRSEELSISSISDFCAYQTLLRLSFQANALRSKVGTAVYRGLLPAGHSIEMTDQWCDNGFVGSRSFAIRRSDGAAP